jgi:hypothetical protein
MRDDMDKVIVERPRRGGLTTHASRRFRNDEERGGKIGMRHGHTTRKSLNENLAPLRRWLASQVNRPWDKVYSELCANIDRRNTVQAHIFTHIDDFVERETRLIDGKVYVLDRWLRKVIPLEEAAGELYVDPVTGILRKNMDRVKFKQRRSSAQSATAAELSARRRDLSDRMQLQKIEGIWYRVELEEIPMPRVLVDRASGKQTIDYPRVWDVVRKRLVSRSAKSQSKERDYPPFGQAWVYAKEKRQVSGAELRKYKLTNDDAGNTRRCCFWSRHDLRLLDLLCRNDSFPHRPEHQIGHSLGSTGSDVTETNRSVGRVPAASCRVHG